MKYNVKIRLCHYLVWLVLFNIVLVICSYTGSTISYLFLGMLVPIPLHLEVYLRNDDRLSTLLSIAALELAQYDKEIADSIEKGRTVTLNKPANKKRGKH